jgi:NADH-quinone oxidoreductase subunit G
MLGALIKGGLDDRPTRPDKETTIVSIMPCTAKKFEAKRPEMARDGVADVDHVITTQELARMIQESGLRFRELLPESFDLPLGFKSGAGVLFGASGGVTEAVLRYATAQVSPERPATIEFHAVRGEEGLREADVALNGSTLHLALVHGLANARRIAEQVRRGEGRWDLIEVMACPGGCIGGAGQPVSRNAAEARHKRRLGIYTNDKQLDVHCSQDNPFVHKLYEQRLGAVGGHKAHELLHTHYQSRRRVPDQEIELAQAPQKDRIVVRVCVGTSCFLRGSQATLTALLRDIAARGLEDDVDVRASFCFENCAGGPSVSVGGKLISAATLQRVRDELERALTARGIESAPDVATGAPTDLVCENRS